MRKRLCLRIGIKGIFIFQNKEHYVARHLIPPSIRRNMLPGIIGERILSGLHVLPANHRLKDKRVIPNLIKPIPERYGSATGK